MRVLALEPFYGGSHRAFLDGWRDHGRHDWTILGLSAKRWRWRMRHASITLGCMVNELVSKGEQWDVVFCSDMLNLPEFRGFVDGSVTALPSVAYFHENQLTYPVREEKERDRHYAFVNILTAIAGTQVWFNSAFHRDSFMTAARNFLRCMPDYRLLDHWSEVEARARVFPQGVRPIEPSSGRVAGPIRILWAARWEYDKNPDDFFAAVRRLRDRGVAFRLSVIGEQYRTSPKVFARAEREFADVIDHWGYQASRDSYETVLRESDISVSTSNHEFFGVSMVETALAGAWPIVPDRLAYPEVFERDSHPQFFYDGTVEGLCEQLESVIRQIEGGTVDRTSSEIVQRFTWERLVGQLDDALERPD